MRVGDSRTATESGDVGKLSATDRLAYAIEDVELDRVPPEVLLRARLCILDLLGVAIAGSAEPAAAVARAVTIQESGGDSATLWGGYGRSSASGAALVNGLAGHALDYDDVISDAGHASTVVVPAAFAVAEEVGATGSELLRAVIRGIETFGLVAEAVGTSHYDRGFHTTGTFGSFGAAAAAAALRGLDHNQLVTALGIAGTQAAGLKSMFGTMTKPLHAGKAAANGVLAAGFAAHGFTASSDILGMHQGFAATQADGLDIDVLQAPSSKGWATEQTQFKMHAACYLTHATIEALSDLRRKSQIGPASIERVDLVVPPGHLDVCAIPEPSTGLEGKFSLKFVAALVLSGYQTSPAMFTDDTVRNPELTALSERVHVHVDPHLPTTATQVAVTGVDGLRVESSRDLLADGDQLDTEALVPRLRDKFESLVTTRLGRSRARNLADAILRIDELASLDGVFADLRGRYEGHDVHAELRGAAHE